MIGLIVITHAQLGSALLDAARMIVGPLARAEAVAVRRELDLETTRAELATRLAEVDSDGDGVLILTDMFGGTPSNLSVAFLDPGRVEVLSGVNLPMVLKFCNSREGASVAELAALLKGYAQQGIILTSELLPQH